MKILIAILLLGLTVNSAQAGLGPKFSQAKILIEKYLTSLNTADLKLLKQTTSEKYRNTFSEGSPEFWEKYLMKKKGSLGTEFRIHDKDTLFHECGDNLFISFKVRGSRPDSAVRESMPSSDWFLLKKLGDSWVVESFVSDFDSSETSFCYLIKEK